MNMRKRLLNVLNVVGMINRTTKKRKTAKSIVQNVLKAVPNLRKTAKKPIQLAEVAPESFVVEPKNPPSGKNTHVAVKSIVKLAKMECRI